MIRRVFSCFTAFFAAAVLSIPAQAVVMLQYHHIDSSTPASTSTRPEMFEEHLQWLKDSDYQVAPLTEITDLIRSGKPLPDKTVVITFDDAYISIYETAFPLLQKYDFPFTIFINTGAVDQRQRRSLTWDQLRKMGKAGVTLANHTIDHNHLVERQKEETKEEWIKRIAKEIKTAEQRIKEETGQNHKLFAWPFGETAPELEQLILDKGYLGFGQQSGAAGPYSNQAKLPRYPMGAGYGSMNSFPLKARSLPLPVINTEPPSNLAPQNGRIGPLQLTLQPGEWVPGQLACYALGTTLEVSWLNKAQTELEIIMPSQLPLGRSRINCTAPGPEGRWFWYSRDWVRLTADGLAID